jgi:DNA mismatch endonuclease (patch repair protein)
MDNLSRRRRSEVMARIKGKDTHPEMVVRKLVFSMGRRYRLHVRELPGAPDLVFPRDHKLIFVHGCFWHPHGRCSRGHVPVSRLEYWKPKLEGNRRRDSRNRRRLRRAGWTLLTIRECELSDLSRVKRQLAAFLSSRPRRLPLKRYATTSRSRRISSAA